ncbi:hypothetical protein BS78_05G157300 [Paspalum vaginatum]|nr:hypothetical protein BS78_05G157300 [Paspalum vaginatum]
MVGHSPFSQRPVGNIVVDSKLPSVDYRQYEGQGTFLMVGPDTFTDWCPVEEYVTDSYLSQSGNTIACREMYSPLVCFACQEIHMSTVVHLPLGIEMVGGTYTQQPFVTVGCSNIGWLNWTIGV